MYNITIDIDNSNMPDIDYALGHRGRKRAFYDSQGMYENNLAICVVAAGRLDKTKLCVNSIINYTDVDYQLILVDNGCDDEIYRYFESVPHTNKIIYRISKNVGCNYALWKVQKNLDARYFAFVANDCIVTRNWIKNLLKCIESDPDIGMVSPGANNISNNQTVNIGQFQTWDAMQKLAFKYNKSNSDLWQERDRLITVCALIRTEVLDYVGSFFDLGIAHDFSDDDLSYRISRAGYKLICCKDTFVAHNHNMSERDSKDLQTSMRSGECAIREKLNDGAVTAYVVCPPNYVTGGVELLHQLAHELSKYLKTYLLFLKNTNGDYIPQEYKKYQNKYVVGKIVSKPENSVVIFPEIFANMALHFNCMKKVIFWESVDNYFNFLNIPVSEYGKDDNILHLAQSEYARDFLSNHVNGNKIKYLSDYINLDFFGDYKQTEREDIVLYNPSKGMDFTEKVIIYDKLIKYVPICNMSRDEVINLMHKCKVYIDFGNHPGKDRLPREAAMCGCCVITGLNGSAAYFEDVPIMRDKYKFERKEENIPQIVERIKNILSDYDECYKDFSGYRFEIEHERERFISDTRDFAMSLKGM